MWVPTILLISVFQCSFAGNQWNRELMELPQDAREIIETHLVCSGFGVDDFNNPAEENVKKYKMNNCQSRFKNNERLRKKYQQNRKILNLLECADLSITQPGQCPL